MEFELTKAFFSNAWVRRNKENRALVSIAWDCPAVRQLKEQRETQELKWSSVDKPLPKNHVHYVYLLKCIISGHNDFGF